MAEIDKDATVVFCDRLINPRARTHDRMVQKPRKTITLGFMEK
jgi:hypothetical protein